jgi:dipeptidyl aminopeptidase/acylaminoacyl peptidase
VDLPPVSELRRNSDGLLVCTLEKADTSALKEFGWQSPERFVTKGRDRKTDIYGVIYRPTTFNPSKKYPVIEDIYASPSFTHVPKAFAAFQEDMELAELGFIVVRIDGMGTTNRSKAFQDVAWQNLGDAGFPDRILWMKAAAATRPYMDLSRVGIYGGSAGGGEAVRALEAFGDFYKAAVAYCGDHDYRLCPYREAEMYMGWPVGPCYAEQSNVTNAGKMNGKLLLMVAELDHTVDPAQTMRLANALIGAKKDFDLLVVPNVDHCERIEYTERRQKDFFVRNLLGVTPPAHDATAQQ